MPIISIEVPSTGGTAAPSLSRHQFAASREDARRASPHHKRRAAAPSWPSCRRCHGSATHTLRRDGRALAVPQPPRRLARRDAGRARPHHKGRAAAHLGRPAAEATHLRHAHMKAGQRAAVAAPPALRACAQGCTRMLLPRRRASASTRDRRRQARHGQQRMDTKGSAKETQTYPPERGATRRGGLAGLSRRAASGARATERRGRVVSTRLRETREQTYHVKRTRARASRRGRSAGRRTSATATKNEDNERGDVGAGQCPPARYVMTRRKRTYGLRGRGVSEAAR